MGRGQGGGQRSWEPGLTHHPHRVSPRLTAHHLLWTQARRASLRGSATGKEARAARRPRTAGMEGGAASVHLLSVSELLALGGGSGKEQGLILWLRPSTSLCAQPALGEPLSVFSPSPTPILVAGCSGLWSAAWFLTGTWLGWAPEPGALSVPPFVSMVTCRWAEPHVELAVQQVPGPVWTESKWVGRGLARSPDAACPNPRESSSPSVFTGGGCFVQGGWMWRSDGSGDGVPASGWPLAASRGPAAAGLAGPRTPARTVWSAQNNRDEEQP